MRSRYRAEGGERFRPGKVYVAPATALYPSMPRAAIAASAVDYVLPLEKIGPMLVRLANSEPNDEIPDTKAV